MPIPIWSFSAFIDRITAASTVGTPYSVWGLDLAILEWWGSDLIQTTWFDEWNGPYVAVDVRSITVNTPLGTVYYKPSPVFEFTGTDSFGHDLAYHFQIGKDQTFPSSSDHILFEADDYDDGNYLQLYAASNIRGAQEFFGAAATATRLAFKLRKVGSPTGSGYAKLFLISAAVPSGNGVAVSAAFDVSTLSTTSAWVVFDLLTPYYMDATQTYAAAFEYTAGDASNRVEMVRDWGSWNGTYWGMTASAYTGTWGALSGNLCFRAYAQFDPVTTYAKISSAHVGFVNAVDGGDTSPFTSGQKISFTIDESGSVYGDYLPNGTHYWRARVIDPAGLNTYSAWSPVRKTVVATAYNKNVVTSNTADAYDFAGDTTPTLEFTGVSETYGYDLHYEIQIATDKDFTPTLVDGYDFASQDDLKRFVSGFSVWGYGQSFTGIAGTLVKAVFRLKHSHFSYSAGSLNAALSAHSGTFGSSSLPGADLAYGIGFHMGTCLAWNTSPKRYHWQDIDIDFANNYTLVAGTKYCIGVYSSSSSGALFVAVDSDSPSHAGNGFSYNDYAGPGGIAEAYDVPFAVYAITASSPLRLVKSSEFSAGFVNTVTPGDVAPFTSGEKIGFTVQAGDALPVGTYYWRVRAKDPTGTYSTQFYNAWSETRSFTI